MTPLATFIDTVSPQSIKIDDSFSGAVAYADGRWAWPLAEVDRFAAAGKHMYRISVTGANPKIASFIDCESGDATAAQAARYVRARNDIAGDGGFYASRSTVAAVVAELGDEPAWLWCADWTGQPHIPQLELPPNVKLALVQYQNLPDRDLSAVYSRAWLG